MGQSIGGSPVEASDGLTPRTSTSGRVGKASATWYTVKGGNDTFWRAEAPAEIIGGRVSYIPESGVVDTFVYPNRGPGLPWQIEIDGHKLLRHRYAWEAFNESARQIESLRPVFPEHEGAAVFTRPCLARATFARYMREQGVRTVAETDDNYFAAAKLNLFLRQQGQSDELKESHAKAFASMDANVFSTQWLLDRYWREFKDRFGERGRQTIGMPEMFVCRNHIPRWAWPERDEGDGKLRVGFMGSPSHVWDVNLAFMAFNHAKDWPNVETVMIGYNPADPDPDMPDTVTVDGEEIHIYSEKARHNIKTWRKVVDRHVRWVDPGDYHRASLPIDIGLAPLRTDDFTLGKSDSKLLEYTINGAAVVCSQMPVFTSAGWRDGVNCLMAGSPAEMAEACVKLIRDPGLRYELVEAAQDMVWNERNEDVMRDEWQAAIQG